MPSIKDKQELRVWEPFLIGLAAAIGLLAGYNMNFRNAESSLLTIPDKATNTQYVSTNGDGRIEEILRFVESKYVDSINPDKITINLINKLLTQLDPHSSYISAENLHDYNERMSGQYLGIGVEILSLRDTFYISKIKELGPASKAGFQLGDALIEINGNKVSGKGLEIREVRAMLRDSVTQNLVLGVQAIGSTEIKELEVKAEKISVSSAEVCYLLNDNTAYLKLSRFSSNTYEQFIEAIEKIKEGKTELNLVLDLRQNPGGFLPEAIKILSQLFVDKDKLLTYTKGLNRKQRDYRTTGNAFYNIKKIAVLIDEDSASGSEIIAGAIQDWDRGILIGQTSYGKGLVQEVFPLRNGGALRLTVAKYYTPGGRLIQKSYSSDSNSFAADSTIHVTKLLERKMESGNGIKPDIVLDNKIERRCYHYAFYSDHFLVNMMKDKGTNKLTRSDISQSAYDDFIRNEFEENPSELAIDCYRDITSKIYNSYKRMTLSNIAYAEYLNVNDTYVLRALDYINDTRPTIALLSQEE